jgi:hypothetical protein
MVRILRYIANRLEKFNIAVAKGWNKWLGKLKM